MSELAWTKSKWSSGAKLGYMTQHYFSKVAGGHNVATCGKWETKWLWVWLSVNPFHPWRSCLTPHDQDQWDRLHHYQQSKRSHLSLPLMKGEWFIWVTAIFFHVWCWLMSMMIVMLFHAGWHCEPQPHLRNIAVSPQLGSTGSFRRNPLSQNYDVYSKYLQ